VIVQQDQLPGAYSLFTDRRGGHSGGTFASLNLGGHVGDDPALVASNRQVLRDALAERAGDQGVQVRYMNQEHGAQVAFVEAGVEEDLDPVDAMVTADPHLALAVLVADCVPVLFADRETGLVAVAHAGRLGLVAEVVPATVRVLREHGARAPQAVIGPSVCPRCYEVPRQLHDDVTARVPQAAAHSWTGTPALDIAAGVLAQLAAVGVSAERVPGCTREDDTLFSYRRDGRTGRFAGVVLGRGAGDGRDATHPRVGSAILGVRPHRV